MRSLTYPRHLAHQVVLLLTVSYLTGCASPAPSGTTTRCAQVNYPVYDPAEPLNRGVFAFNRTVDNYALAPVARGYRYLPDFFQQGVHNFASNFSEPKVFINDLLQGNPRRSVNTLGRFALNTTVGVVGLIDVSDRVGIPRHSADCVTITWRSCSGVLPTISAPSFSMRLIRSGAFATFANSVLSRLMIASGVRGGAK